MAWHFLTDAERDLIQKVLDESRGKSINPPVQNKEEQDYQAPEVYIAKPQNDIPALNDSVDPAIAGVEDCDIYRITLNSTGQAEIVEMEGLSKKVYNYTTSEISSDSYVVITKTKAGKWIPLVQAPSPIVLGPCSQYTPDISLLPTDLEIDFPEGCFGPERYGLVYRNLVSGDTSFRNLELQSGTASPLAFRSGSFTHACASGSLTLYAILTVSGLDVEEVVLTFYKVSDDSIVAEYWNKFYRWLPLVGGYLQLKTSPCDCSTFPYDVCVDAPSV